MKLDKNLITAQADLVTICEQATNYDAIGIDTEFLREKTYYAKLCLVQIALGENFYCIDVLALGDLTPLAELLKNESVVKVFHSCRQDFEVIYQQLGCLPSPVFDTQLAAAFCGNDAQIGYANLLQQEYGIELDKSQTRTDWSRRPLREEQVEYALNDVAYLVRLYEDYQHKLEQSGRLDWFLEDTQQFFVVDDYAANADLAYQRLNGGGLKVINQQFLLVLANWRERLAQKKDIPRTWILKDKELYALAELLPISAEKLQQSSLQQQAFVRKNSKQIVAYAVECSEKRSEERVWRAFQPFDAKQKNHCQALMEHLAVMAKDRGLAQSMLATRRDIEAFVRDNSDSRISQGWRAQLLLEPLMAVGS